MAKQWSLEDLQKLPAAKVQIMYRNVRDNIDPEAKRIAALILDNDLLLDERGGLPFDHPTMLKIEEICSEPDAIAEAIEAADQGFPPLAGMEHRIVAALGTRYGKHYTTNHAGLCIARAFPENIWLKMAQKPMPDGSVAKTATVFVRRNQH